MRPWDITRPCPSPNLSCYLHCTTMSLTEPRLSSKFNCFTKKSKRLVCCLFLYRVIILNGLTWLGLSIFQYNWNRGLHLILPTIKNIESDILNHPECSNMAANCKLYMEISAYNGAFRYSVTIKLFTSRVWLISHLEDVRRQRTPKY